MNGNGFYTTKEVLERVGIARPTLYKWIKKGKVPKVARDRNNFRLFTEENIKIILEYKDIIKPPYLTEKIQDKFMGDKENG